MDLCAMSERSERIAQKFAIDDFLARTNAKPTTIDNYRDKLLRMESWLGKPLGAATEKDIARLKSSRLSKMKAGYHYADMLKMFYRKAGRLDLIPLLGMSHAQVRIRPEDLLTSAEIQKMINVCPVLRDQ